LVNCNRNFTISDFSLGGVNRFSPCLDCRSLTCATMDTEKTGGCQAC
jgi:hypothetical protein